MYQFEASHIPLRDYGVVALRFPLKWDVVVQACSIT